MKKVFYTRLLFWKKQWKTLLWWTLFPFILTTIIVSLADSVKDETKIPVGIVLEEETPLALQLYYSINETPHIRPVLLNEREAIDQAQTHKLDSVFIIKKGYDRDIERGSRNELIKSYSTDFSFAYMPLKELVVSYVQQDFSRSQAAYVVKELHQTYHSKEKWVWLDLINRSKEIEREQNLLTTTISFEDSLHIEQNDNVIDVWTVWVLMTFLATFLLFDWSIKENKQTLLTRFIFSNISYKKYLMINGLIYTLLLLFVDYLTIFILSVLFEMELSFILFIVMLGYRLALNICAFLMSLLFKSAYPFYIATFMLFVIVILSSGAIIPLDGVYATYPLIKWLNPLEPILSINVLNHWLLIAMIGITFWFMRKEESYA